MEAQEQSRAAALVPVVLVPQVDRWYTNGVRRITTRLHEESAWIRSASLASGSFLIGVPLVWAVLLLFHPLGSGEMYDELRDEVARWQVVHVGTLFFIGLMGLAVYLLVRDLPGTAARKLLGVRRVRPVLRSLGSGCRPRRGSPRSIHERPSQG